ncbi:hypothetical protein NQ317_009091 [Molorchus minor]|uniref:Uncharacterized protein n=1 Tax=Molorchus minor TaxID=1323400 RepID=A0ABQ9JLS4_9CUCU|nr:hypothetical protein NQ317_009091 [Molorchus minor]
MQGNHILEIPKAETLIIEVEKLTVISNHFPCNCHIHTLLEGPLANGSILDFISKNFCISPLEVNGRPMTNIDVESIGRCEEEVTRGNLEASKDSVNDSNTTSALLIKCVCLLIATAFVRLIGREIGKLQPVTSSHCHPTFIASDILPRLTTPLVSKDVYILDLKNIREERCLPILEMAKIRVNHSYSRSQVLIKVYLIELGSSDLFSPHVSKKA